MKLSRSRQLYKLFGLLLCLWFIGNTVSTLFAHAQLVSSIPQAGETLEIAPNDMLLVFNEAMSRDSVVMLVDQNFGRTPLEITLHGDSISTTLPPLEDGVYTVQYDVISVDGHPISGSFEFAIAEPAASFPIIPLITGLIIGATLSALFASKHRQRRTNNQ